MPHQFAAINCQYCGENYCPVCKEKCPKCGKDGIKSNQYREYIENWRKNIQIKMSHFNIKK